MATQQSKAGRNGHSRSKITKVEGLRRAIAELGQEASTDDLQKYIKKNFGLEMSKDHIYVSKGLIRKQDAKKVVAQPEGKGEPATKPAEPTPPTTPHASNGTATAVAPPVPTSKAGGISKMEGIRQSLRELGKKATPTAIQLLLVESFGIQMSREAIRKYKSKILKSLAGKKKAKAKARKGDKEVIPIRQEEPATSLPVRESEPKGIRFEDILLVKNLVGRVGLDKLRTLVTVFTS